MKYIKRKHPYQYLMSIDQILQAQDLHLRELACSLSNSEVKNYSIDETGWCNAQQYQILLPQEQQADIA